jgi:hypothetical protein
LATEYLLNKNFNANSLKLCTLRLESIIICFPLILFVIINRPPLMTP